jgi:hypothetical protein
MNKKGLSFILFGFFGGVVLLAQQAPDGPRQILPAPNTAASVSSYEEPLPKKFYKRLIRATKRYKLTSEQQAQVKSILQREQADDQVVNADELMSGREKGKEQARLFEESQKRIGTVLNKQQKRKFDKDETTRAWMDGRLPNPNPGPPF